MKEDEDEQMQEVPLPSRDADSDAEESDGEIEIDERALFGGPPPPDSFFWSGPIKHPDETWEKLKQDMDMIRKEFNLYH